MRNPSPCHLISFPSLSSLLFHYAGAGGLRVRGILCADAATLRINTTRRPSSTGLFCRILLTGFQFGQINPACSRCSPRSHERHNRTGYVNISQLMAEDRNDPLPVQRTVCKGRTLSRCYVFCSKPLEMLLLFGDLSCFLDNGSHIYIHLQWPLENLINIFASI